MLFDRASKHTFSPSKNPWAFVLFLDLAADFTVVKKGQYLQGKQNQSWRLIVPISRSTYIWKALTGRNKKIKVNLIVFSAQGLCMIRSSSSSSTQAPEHSPSALCPNTRLSESSMPNGFEAQASSRSWGHLMVTEWLENLFYLTLERAYPCWPYWVLQLLENALLWSHWAQKQSWFSLPALAYQTIHTAFCVCIF